MGDIGDAIEERHFAKDYICLMFLQRLLHPLGALEPYELYFACIIIQLSSKASLSAFTLFGDVDELTY